MTVAELIARLTEIPQDAEVYVYGGDGYYAATDVASHAYGVSIEHGDGDV